MNPKLLNNELNSSIWGYNKYRSHNSFLKCKHDKIDDLSKACVMYMVAGRGVKDFLQVVNGDWPICNNHFKMRIACP